MNFSCRLLFLTLFSLFSIFGRAQCPVADFNLQSNLCIGEGLNLVNNTDPSLNFEWDFCAGSISNTASLLFNENISAMDNVFGVDHVKEDNQYFTFLINRRNGVILRINHGTTIDNQFSVVNLGNPGGALVSPQEIALVQENNQWFGLVSSLSGVFYRLDFGNSVTNPPSATDLGSLGSASNFGEIVIVKEGGNTLAVSTGGDGSARILILDFGSSILNTPLVTIHPITGSRPYGISVIFDCSNWYGLLADNTTGVFRLEFGNSLKNSPSVTNVGGVSRPRGVELINDAGNYFGVAVNQVNSELFRLNFGNDLSNTPVVDNLGNFGVLNTTIGMDLEQDSSVFRVFTAGFTNDQFHVIEFDKNCPASASFSGDFQPKDIQYQQAGTYTVSMKAFQEESIVREFNRQVTVSGNVSPEVSITGDLANCIDLSSSFSGNNLTPSSTIISWNWDFGDGSFDTGQNVSHIYSTPGVYSVSLNSISADGCNQFAFQEIIIYDEPVAGFTVQPGNLCSNQGIQFTNNSTITDSVATWLWDFGDGNVSTDRDPVHVFNGPGNYNVTLTAQLPGCSDMMVQAISVISGPDVDFLFDDTCAGDPVNFSDQSTGAGLISWFWDFGNGVTSTQQNPVLLYSDPGDYNVSLTVGNTDGCSSTSIQPITIYGIPQVAFSNDLACSSESAQFFDLTTIPNANPVSWTWDFGDGSGSTLQNPLHQFPGPGDYNVKLAVASNFGCIDSIEQVIVVNSSPVADFEFDPVCSGETMIFRDLSDAGSGLVITDWLWQIDGQFLTDQNPEFLFSDPGDYLVELIVTSSNLCTESVSQLIRVNEQPIIGFDPANTCSGQFTFFQNLSSPAAGDEISGYLWDFGGLGVSTQRDPQFVFTDPGTYTVSLEIQTLNGCVRNLSQEVMIEQSPVAEFEVSATLGSPPMEVEFINNSGNASTYLWDFGTGDNSNETSPTYIFTEEGAFEVILVSTNENCRDTTRQIIRVEQPEMDVSLDDLFISEDNGLYRIDLFITNRGTTIIDQMNLITDISGNAKISEAFPGQISVGESVSYTLSVNPLDQGLEYLCIELLPIDGELSDINPSDNRACLSFENLFISIPAYPNPSSELVNLDYVIPVGGEIEIELLDFTGKRVLREARSVSNPGLQSFRINVSSLGSGVYMLRSRYENVEKIQKIILQ